MTFPPACSECGDPMMKNDMKTCARETRQIAFVPPRHKNSRPVSLLVYPRAGSRCRSISKSTFAVTLTGAEVRLMCDRQWHVHGRAQYRIPARTRNANRDYIPARTGSTFRTVFGAEDSQVRIGWEIFGSKRRPVVHLTAKPRTRVRTRGSGISWWPSIAEIDALGRLYGKARPPAHSTPETTQGRLQQMKADLRALLEQQHPELARRHVSLTQSSTEDMPKQLGGADVQ
jgi:hypothetical protein